MHEARARKVRQDGIHFEGLRYLSTTLAAYVGEAVTVRFDPREMGEVRSSIRIRFLRRAIAADFAGDAVPLREIRRARNSRRRELRSVLHKRQQAVDALLALKRGPAPENSYVQPVLTKPASTKLKRYRNE